MEQDARLARDEDLAPMMWECGNAYIKEGDGDSLNGIQHKVIFGNTEYDWEDSLLNHLFRDNWQMGQVKGRVSENYLAPMMQADGDIHI